MNGLTPARLAWLGALLLGGAVAFEVAPMPEQPPERPAAAAPPRPAIPIGSEPVAAWAVAALARPVFAPGRRPDATAATRAMADAPAGLPRLTGIVLTAAGRRAIFAASSASARADVLGEGGAVGAWRIEAIRAGDVLVAGPDGQRTLRPTYAETASPPPALEMQLPQGLQPDPRPPSALPQARGVAAPNAPGPPAFRIP